MTRSLRPALTLFLLLTFVVGGVYPVAVWAVGRLFFAEKAQGEPLAHQGQTVGYALIGQAFTQDKYFWPRPSATASGPYSVIGAGASNMSVANPRHLADVVRRAKHLRENHPQASRHTPFLPADLVTASGSGLDPHISPEAARFQIERIAAVRGLNAASVKLMVDEATESPTFGFIGQPRVNVLRLNLTLDATKGAAHD